MVINIIYNNISNAYNNHRTMRDKFLPNIKSLFAQ